MVGCDKTLIRMTFISIATGSLLPIQAAFCSFQRSMLFLSIKPLPIEEDVSALLPLSQLDENKLPTIQEQSHVN